MRFFPQREISANVKCDSLLNECCGWDSSGGNDGAFKSRLSNTGSFRNVNTSIHPRGTELNEWAPIYQGSCADEAYDFPHYSYPSSSWYAGNGNLSWDFEPGARDFNTGYPIPTSENDDSFYSANSWQYSPYSYMNGHGVDFNANADAWNQMYCQYNGAMGAYSWTNDYDTDWHGAYPNSFSDVCFLMSDDTNYSYTNGHCYNDHSPYAGGTGGLHDSHSCTDQSSPYSRSINRNNPRNMCSSPGYVSSAHIASSLDGEVANNSYHGDESNVDIEGEIKSNDKYVEEHVDHPADRELVGRNRKDKADSGRLKSNTSRVVTGRDGSPHKLRLGDRSVRNSCDPESQVCARSITRNERSLNSGEGRSLNSVEGRSFERSVTWSRDRGGHYYNIPSCSPPPVRFRFPAPK